MRIRMLPSAVTGGGQEFLTTFIVNGSVAIDAGGLGFWDDLIGQQRVDHVFLSHSHADHVCSLPMFVTNTLDTRARNVVVHAHAPVLESLSRDIFNGRLWPDFLLPADGSASLLDLDETSAGAHAPWTACASRRFPSITPCRPWHTWSTMGSRRW